MIKIVLKRRKISIYIYFQFFYPLIQDKKAKKETKKKSYKTNIIKTPQANSL